jgi:16S rRNA (guanine(527)-N(7))-methyltransferase RsmG
MDSGIELKRLLENMEITAGSEKGLKLLAFLSLLQKWNARIDLTASTEWELLGPMFVEALWASAYYPKDTTLHLDIGSGAGFPAIPIRIMAPQMKLEMVESREKRAIFLECTARELGLLETNIHQARLDKFLATNEKSWDGFSWKAVKLSNNDMNCLFRHAHPETLFWLFHGKNLPVEDDNIINEKLEIATKQSCPGRNEWELSIYRLKRVAGFGFPVSG